MHCASQNVNVHIKQNLYFFHTKHYPTTSANYEIFLATDSMNEFDNVMTNDSH